MRVIPFMLLLLTANITVYAQSNKNLLGVCTRDSLLTPAYKDWLEPNYTDYLPDKDLVLKLKKALTAEITIEVFFGTWCGDSKREVPRFFKIMDAANFSAQKIKLIAVGTGEAYKQSPGAETMGKGIYRVATFIVYKQGVELGRITEHPVYTLEEDLYKILTGGGYEPNFRAYKQIDQWLVNKVLTNPNVSIKGLAKQLKPILISPSELNSCVQVLIAQKLVKDAIAVAKMNVYVFYDNVEAYTVLARALSKDGQHKAALENIQYAIQLNKDENELQYLLNTFYSIKLASE